MRKISFLFLSFFFFLAFHSIPSFAQQGTISVSPQLIQLDLNTDQPEAEYFYTNDTGQTIELSLTINDVKELEDRGIPDILSQQDSKNYKYGLASWAKFSSNNVVITPGETKKVTVYIEADRLSIGGHYASILAEVKQLDKQGPVKLRAILSSLLFVRQGGGNETEEARIYDLYSDSELLSFPKEFTFRLNNTGNVDLTPYGRLSVRDWMGREVAVGIVNEDSLITLPESIRRYTIPVKDQNEFKLPGLYKATLDAHYGKSKIKTAVSKTFISLGSIPPFIAILSITVLCVLVFALFKLRRGNNRAE